MTQYDAEDKKERLIAFLEQVIEELEDPDTFVEKGSISWHPNITEKNILSDETMSIGPIVERKSVKLNIDIEIGRRRTGKS